MSTFGGLMNNEKERRWEEVVIANLTY